MFDILGAEMRRIWLLLVGISLVPAALWAVTKIGRTAAPARPGLASNAPTPLASRTPGVSAAPSIPFPRGACLSFAPTSGAARGVVFLDAGHGGLDPGASGKTSAGKVVVEKTVALAIVKAATAAFRDQGYRVVVSRWADTTVNVRGAGDVRSGALTPEGVQRDLLARVACANAARADVLISVHVNAFSDPSVGGASTIYDADRTFSVDNRRLAGLLQANVVSALRRAGWQVADRSIMKDTENPGGALTEEGARYGHDVIIGPYAKGWVPSPSLMPGAIMEPLFLSRPAEADIAASEEGQVALAKAMTAAVRQFLAGP